MGVQLPARRGFGDLTFSTTGAPLGASVNEFQAPAVDEVIEEAEAAAANGQAPIASMVQAVTQTNTTIGNTIGGSDVSKLPGSGDPKAPVSSGATAKAETNWLGWGLVAAGVGGLLLVGFAARKQRRRRS